MMRKSTKAVLRNHLLGTKNATIPTTNDVCVVDGGALLHKVHWPKSTYSEVLEQYIAFVKQRFGKYTCVNVVFDGYSDRMSTKGQEHLRRMSKTSASIEITESSKVTCSRKAFLANIDSKDRLIKLLCTRLERERFVAVQSNGDADISIVKTALEYAETGRCVVVMAEDTDILVLMMSHWRDGLGELFLGTEKKEKRRRHSKLLYWSMRDLLSTQQYQEALLFAHAWSGCDTTSAMHQKGMKLK